MHVVFALYGTPKHLSQIEEWVNHDLEYDWEGPFRRGKHRPTLSRLPLGLYEVRIKKELAPQFIADLRLVHPSDPLSWRFVDVNKVQLLIRAALWFFRLLTTLQVTPKAKEILKHYPKGWLYGWYIGSFPDKHFDGQESL